MRVTAEMNRSSGPGFLSYYKPHLGLFILDMCCALGIALVDLAFPWASREAMNKLLPQSLYAAR